MPLVKRNGKPQRRGGRLVRRSPAAPNIPTLVSVDITLTRNVPIPAPGIQLVIQGGTAPYTVVDTGLAPNLSINATGLMTGTSTTAGDDPATVTITDANGVSSVPTILTIHTEVASDPLIIFTTVVDLQQNVAIPSPGQRLVALGGDGDYTWGPATSLPAGNPALAVSSTGYLTGKPTGSGDDTFNVTVTDGQGESVQSTITARIEAEDTPGVFAGYENRRIGFCMNAATPAMVRELGDVIAAGTNRLQGGKIRKDIGGIQLGGSNSPSISNGGSADLALDAIQDVGAQCNAILGYSHRDDQRTLTFEGTTEAGNMVRWTGGIGTGLSSQGGVAGHRPTLPAGGYVIGQCSVRGPGIAYIRNFTGSTVQGQNVFQCTLPTGNNHGAGANFNGCGVKGPGLQNNTKITGAHNGTGFPIDKACNATRAPGGGYTIGRFVQDADPGPWQCTLGEYQYSAVGSTAVPLTGGVTGGKSGTYTLGGSNANGDSKFPYKNPVDAQTVAHAVVTQGGSRVGTVEAWNEVAWPLGSRPFTDVPLLCRIFAHQYVGAKLAAKAQNRFVQFMMAGTGMINDDTTYLGLGAQHFFNARQWYDKIIDWYLNDDPTYFSDLLTANGLTKERAPLFPADSLAMHPYGNGVMDAWNMGMNQTAYVFNTVGAAVGDYLPICLVEQGLTWNRDGTGTSLGGRPNLSAGVAYTRYKQWNDILHGNIPWPYNTHLNGPGANMHKATGATNTATTITLTDRRIAARKCFVCPEWFAIMEPENAHGPLGIAFTGGVRKYIPGTNDPVQAMKEV
jgi:hypothetical protein